jgi:hypothetical protein
VLISEDDRGRIAVSATCGSDVTFTVEVEERLRFLFVVATRFSLFDFCSAASTASAAFLSSALLAAFSAASSAAFSAASLARV